MLNTEDSWDLVISNFEKGTTAPLYPSARGSWEATWANVPYQGADSCILKTEWSKKQQEYVFLVQVPIGSMYAIYGNIYHQYTPNVSIYSIHGASGV